MIIATFATAPSPTSHRRRPRLIPTDFRWRRGRAERLKSSPGGGKKWLTGNPREEGEYRDLRAMIGMAADPQVDAAISGCLGGRHSTAGHVAR